jgi:hypothetical protein
MVRGGRERRESAGTVRREEAKKKALLLVVVATKKKTCGERGKAKQDSDSTSPELEYSSCPRTNERIQHPMQQKGKARNGTGG